MTFNLIAYTVYGILMILIIVRIGWLCYTNGKIYVAKIMPNDQAFTISINRLLLTGYYLVNIGYSIYTISTWTEIRTAHTMIAEIASHSGQILFILAGLHYFNILALQLFFNKHSFTTKSL